MKSFHFGKKEKLLWGLFLAAAWGTVIYLFLRHQGGFSAKELASYHPENPLLSCLVMLGLFALKSVDFLIHSGVLYAASGIMFPLPAALLLNVVGTVIAITPTYFLGKALGSSMIDSLMEKYPKLRAFAQTEEGGSLLIAFLLRAIGLPIQVGSLYMGAANYRFSRFLLGSLLGLLHVIIPYTVMGDKADNVGSPIFIIAIVIEVLSIACSAVVWAVISRRRLKEMKLAENRNA